jgi:dihydrofolate reductase
MSRTVVTNMTLTLDGRYHGPQGPQDMSMVMPYVLSDTSRNHLTRLWENATTAFLGRTNAEGFLAFWPPVADQAEADPRDRAFAAWLRDTEKVVLSRSLTEPPWERTRLANAPTAEVVDQLKAEPGGDIVVLASASVIKALLAADRIDRFCLILTPEILGTGPRLLEDGLPASRWTLARQEVGAHGEMSLEYARVRSSA